MIVDITVDDTVHRVNFDDWSPDEWAKFETDTGANWLTWNPFRTAVDAARLVDYAAATFAVGGNAVERAASSQQIRDSLGTRAKFIAAVKYVADNVDMPEEYENGVPPEADDHSTGSSSESSADTDGLPTSSDDNPSET
jgi:hypothetical protein